MVEPPISMPGADPPPTGERGRALEAVLVTVHGTFAARAPWAKSNSVLARAVLKWLAQRGGAATVVPFQWSGRNSIAARRAAGACLAERLDRIRRDHPQSALYVIAHSHGGSVFAYATKLRPEIVEKIDGFVALATPWIGVEPCTYAGALREMLWKLALYVAFGAILFAVPYPMEWVLSEAGAFYHDMDPLAGGLANIAMTIAWSCLAAAGLGLIFFWLQRFVSRRLEGSTAVFQRQLDNIAQELSTLYEGLPPTAFFKPIGDEAALALTWTSAMAALMHGVSILLFRSLQSMRDSWTRVPRIARIIGGLILTVIWSAGSIIVYFVVNTRESLSYTLLVNFSQSWDTVLFHLTISVLVVWTLFSWAVALLVAFSALVVLLVALLAAAGVGVLSLKTALYFRISIEAIPVGSHRLVLVDTSSPRTPGSTRVASGGLSHSLLYNSPGAIRAVIEALGNFEAARLARCRPLI